MNLREDYQSQLKLIAGRPEFERHMLGLWQELSILDQQVSDFSKVNKNLKEELDAAKNKINNLEAILRIRDIELELECHKSISFKEHHMDSLRQETEALEMYKRKLIAEREIKELESLNAPKEKYVITNTGINGTGWTTGSSSVK